MGRLLPGETFDCQNSSMGYVSGPFPMPKSTTRSKTRKSVAKRFKVTARGKLLRTRGGRRHLLQCKSAKRKRKLAKSILVHDSDAARIKANLPFA
jgi:large subunit ribosomal protein L35